MKRKALICILILIFNVTMLFGISKANCIMLANDFMIRFNSKKDDKEDEKPISVDTSYDGEDYKVIGKKLDKNFKESILLGHGEIIAKYSINKGVNPYLIGGIIMENTNCNMECNAVVTNCMNVGYLKGSPGCFGGSYKKYNNMDDGIKELVDYILKKFYANNKTTPDSIYEKYGQDIRWAYNVNKYMEIIKRTSAK